MATNTLNVIRPRSSSGKRATLSLRFKRGNTFHRGVKREGGRNHLGAVSGARTTIMNIGQIDTIVSLSCIASYSLSRELMQRKTHIEQVLFAGAWILP